MDVTVDWYNYVPTLLSGVIYAYLVYCGIKWRMLEEFRTFYLYVMVSSLASMTNWTVIATQGYASYAYVYSYFSGQTAKLLCELAILVVIYRKVHRRGQSPRWVPALVIAAALGGAFWALLSGSLRQVTAVPVLAQCVFLVLIWVPGLMRRRITPLGLNWGGLLIGISLGALLKLNHMALGLFEGLQTEQWRNLLQPIEFAPWVIFALTMGSRDRRWISRRRRFRRPADTVAADHSTSPRAEFGPEMVRRVR